LVKNNGQIGHSRLTNKISALNTTQMIDMLLLNLDSIFQMHFSLTQLGLVVFFSQQVKMTFERVILIRLALC